MKPLLRILPVFFAFFLCGLQTACAGLNPFVDDYEIRGDRVIFISRMQGLGSRNRFVVQDADAKTFKNLGDGYGRDKTLAFYLGHVIPGAEGSSFKLIEAPYARDKNQVYYANKPLSQDPQNFQILISNGSGRFSKDSQSVYTNDNPIADADPATFESLGQGYFRDKNAVFYGAVRLEGSNGPSAKIIPSRDGHFARDQNAVYLNGIKIATADPGTFEVIDDLYSKDKNHIYNSQKILSDDPKGFRLYRMPNGSSRRYARDSQKVYISYRELANADTDSFEVLNYWYAKDKALVWYDGKVVVDADPKSFIALNDDYGKDRQRVYYKGILIPEADVATFKISRKNNGSFAVDKNHVYWIGHIRNDKKVEDYQ